MRRLQLPQLYSLLPDPRNPPVRRPKLSGGAAAAASASVAAVRLRDVGGSLAVALRRRRTARRWQRGGSSAVAAAVAAARHRDVGGSLVAACDGLRATTTTTTTIAMGDGAMGSGATGYDDDDDNDDDNDGRRRRRRQQRRQRWRRRNGAPWSGDFRRPKLAARKKRASDVRKYLSTYAHVEKIAKPRKKVVTASNGIKLVRFKNARLKGLTMPFH
jgi:hypothetical protein